MNAMEPSRDRPRRTPRQRRIAQEWALLKCLEWFRDELHHTQTERVEEKYQLLLNLTADALDWPSVSDSYMIEDAREEAMKTPTLKAIV